MSTTHHEKCTLPHCSDAQTPRLLRPPWYIEFQDGNKLQGLRRTTLTCMHLADFVKTVPCSLANSKELQDHSIDQYHLGYPCLTHRTRDWLQQTRLLTLVSPSPFVA